MAGQLDAPRTLADLLRGWPDARVSALLTARPDLTTPAPHDSAALASRAATRSSVLMALDQLDRLELSVLDALVVSGQTTFEELFAMVNAARPACEAALTRVSDLLLVWESPTGLRAVNGVADALRSDRRSAVGAVRPLGTELPAGVEPVTALAGLSDPARRLLHHVVEHRSTAVAASGGAVARAQTELVEAGLLRRRDAHVVVPGEVVLALHGGTTTADPVDAVPPVPTTARSQEVVDRTAAGAAFEAVRRVELLLDGWGQHPPGVLRSGGLAVRDLKAAARDLHLGESQTALLAETARSAGLLAESTGGTGELAWVPTDSFDQWVAQPASSRWERLVRAWWDSRRVPALVGTKDSAGKTWNALAPELSSEFTAETRHRTMAVLAELAPGEVVAAGTGPAGVVARLAWLRPRRPVAVQDQVGWALAEAEMWGLTAFGGLSTAGRAMVSGEFSEAVAALEPLLPAPVEQVLLQADLTAVAPGPLRSDVARDLHLLADVESRGGATVYRFAAGSVRRGLDAGWSTAEIHAFLDRVSATPVPQPLHYLVDDVARTHGTVRAGYAECFLRSDDTAALDVLCSDPAAARLGLRRLAPTVVISATGLEELLPRLRELGLAPVVEGLDGTVTAHRADLHRARTPRPPRGEAVESARAGARVSAALSALRAGDTAAANRPRGSTVSRTAADHLTALRQAAETGASVVVGYADNHGTVTERVLDPIRVEGGELTARDHRSDDVRQFAVHRISQVRTLEPRP